MCDFFRLEIAIAAALMGLLGYYFSNRAIFYFTAVLAIPAYIALAQIRSTDICEESFGGRRRLGAARVRRRAGRPRR